MLPLLNKYVAGNASHRCGNLVLRQPPVLGNLPDDYVPYFAGRMRMADVQVRRTLGSSPGDVNGDVMVMAAHIAECGEMAMIVH